jgi:phage terminase large subunit
MPKSTFDQLDMRCSDTVFMDYNPVGKLWSDDLVKQDNAIIIHSTFKDNPFVPLEQRKDIVLLSQQNTINNKPQPMLMWSVYGLGLKQKKKPTVSLKGWKTLMNSF